MNSSKTQIDRMGERLKAGPSSQTDLVLLDGYRRSFSEAYEVVIVSIRDRLSLEATGRPAKSTSSVIEKLRRETIRLSQIQDIAGCRVITANIPKQDEVVDAIQGLFPGATQLDRRSAPSHGYRAVHVVAKVSGKLVEVQVRTAMQHLWAELSEKLSDVVDPALKYGGGPEEFRSALDVISKAIEGHESIEKRIAAIDAKETETLDDADRATLREIRETAVSQKARLTDRLSEAILKISHAKGKQ